MRNYVSSGATLTLTPTIAVASGVGFLFGTSLFGLAKGAVAANTPGEFHTEGVHDVAKTSALAIVVGDRLYWDAANKVVNKTAAGQQQVGVAVAAAANPSTTVRMKLMSAVATGA